MIKKTEEVFWGRLPRAHVSVRVVGSNTRMNEIMLDK